MKYLIRALHAELMKTKRTLAFWLALIAPAVIVGLQALIFYDRHEIYLAKVDTFDVWIEYGAQTLFMWGLLMLPLFITLETALVAQWEHRGQQWKHLFALPVPRGVFYVAKELAGMFLIGLSCLFLVALIVLSGWGLRLLIPGLGFEKPVPVMDFIHFASIMFLGAWLMISLQTWVAQRWSSFAVASAVGIAITVIGVVAIQSEKWGPYYPSTLPVIVANGFVDSMSSLNGLTTGLPFKELAFGIFGGILAALIGGWEIVRRDVL
ncbi:MAG: ABC transporter permease [Anaerolineae bacterium]